MVSSQCPHTHGVTVNISCPHVQRRSISIYTAHATALIMEGRGGRGWLLVQYWEGGQKYFFSPTFYNLKSIYLGIKLPPPQPLLKPEARKYSKCMKLGMKPRLQLIVRGNWSVNRKWTIGHVGTYSVFMATTFWVTGGVETTKFVVTSGRPVPNNNDDNNQHLKTIHNQADTKELLCWTITVGDNRDTSLHVTSTEL